MPQIHQPRGIPGCLLVEATIGVRYRGMGVIAALLPTEIRARTSDAGADRDERAGAQAVCGAAAGDRWEPKSGAGSAGIRLVGAADSALAARGGAGRGTGIDQPTPWQALQPKCGDDSPGGHPGAGAGTLCGLWPHLGSGISARRWLYRIEGDVASLDDRCGPVASPAQAAHPPASTQGATGGIDPDRRQSPRLVRRPWAALHPDRFH